jgi:hypothetical protein
MVVTYLQYYPRSPLEVLMINIEKHCHESQSVGQDLNPEHVKYEAGVKIAVFWVVAPCSLVEPRRQQSSYSPP